MKKFIATAILLVCTSLAGICAQDTLSANVVFTLEKKDTNLINLPHTENVDSKKLMTKLQNDHLVYQGMKKNLNEEYYNLYIILDRLLRSNQLSYQNWRFGMNLDAETVNAYAGSGNLIMINS